MQPILRLGCSPRWNIRLTSLDHRDPALVYAPHTMARTFDLTIEGSPLFSKHVVLWASYLDFWRESTVKKPKSYDDYKAEAKAAHDRIMAKYGAPAGAKPPQDKSPLPASSDRNYRRYAFINKRRLEAWPKSGRNYD